MARPNPFAGNKAPPFGKGGAKAKDAAKDKAKGLKEGSPKDLAIDKTMGFKRGGRVKRK